MEISHFERRGPMLPGSEVSFFLVGGGGGDEVVCSGLQTSKIHDTNMLL